MNRAEILESALAAVNARPKAYGPPERNFDRIAPPRAGRNRVLIAWP